MTWLNNLLKRARQVGASDLHVVGGVPPAVRINGEIVMMKDPAVDPRALPAMVMEILTPQQQTTLEATRELCFSVMDPVAGRSRVTVYFHAGYPELSVRLSFPQIPDAEALGLPMMVDELARLRSGLIIVAGATGSGKTTTLSYIVDLINRERRAKIVTIEDPVEFVHRPLKSIIVQQEVGSDTPSFSRALIHVLRQNPDVIVIGEMRELDAISTALTAAETGHLVLATLHTRSSAQTMERITAAFPASQQPQIVLQLANTLQAVITQDLIPSPEKRSRVLAYELMIANAAVRNHIREGSLHQLFNAIDLGKKEGMVSMDQCLLELYQKGLITYDAAVTRARIPARFTREGRAQP